jgi:NADPH:quinone reductase-like Zn-dependent oxidoreductase
VRIDEAVPDQELGRMRAAVLERVGGPFELRTVRRPEPGPGEVLVRVVASGVNPLDTKIQAGTAAHAQVRVPAVLGIDVAGVVASLGEGVTGLAVGDEVFGLTGGIGETPGSLAEYQAVDARLLARKPQRLTMTEAAALPLSFVTVYEGLVDRARVAAGQSVLVQGGAGGVGHIGVQLANALGAQVYATASGAGLDLVRKLGGEPIDYRAVPVEQYVREFTGGLGFDVILDTVGGPTLDASFTAVRRYTGHVVSVLGWGTHSLAPLSFRGATYSGVFTLLPLLTGEEREHHGEILRYAAELADRGALTPHLHERVFTLETVAEAHEAVGSPQVRGKVVVQVA